MKQNDAKIDKSNNPELEMVQDIISALAEICVHDFLISNIGKNNEE